MADFYSDLMTNIVASPMVTNPARTGGAGLKYKGGKFEVDGSLVAAGDVIRFFRIRSSDIIYTLEFSTAGIAGMGDCDTGLFEIHEGVAVDPNALNDGLDLSTARNRLDVIGGGQSDLTDAQLGLPVWQLVVPALSEDPEVLWDIAVTCISEPTGSDGITIEMVYSTP